MRLSRGSTLVELLVYLAVFAVVSIALFDTLVSFSHSFVLARGASLITRTSRDLSERIVRDARSSYAVAQGESVFGSHPGVLTLSRVDGGVAGTVKYELLNGQLRVVDSSGATALTDPRILVEEFKVWRVASGTEAVRFELGLRYDAPEARRVTIFGSGLLAGLQP